MTPRGRSRGPHRFPSDFAQEDVATVKVAELVGDDMQMPPAFSAIKKDGQTAYKAAREGKDLELEARPISITDAYLLGVEPGPPIAWNLSLTVSKGTYIRAIARDLGRDLGNGCTPGHAPANTQRLSLCGGRAHARRARGSR